MKLCRGCGKDISGTIGQQKFCSIDCRKAFNLKLIPELPPRVKYRDKFANLGAVCQRCGADISHKSVVAKFCSRYCKTRTNDDERLKSGYFKTRYAANNEELKEEARVRMANRREADPAFRRSQAYLVGKRRKHVALIQDGTVDFKVILGERKSCPYCGQVLCEENTVVDHMEPLALNGEHSANNLVACCRECNQKKAAKPFIVWLGELPEARRAAAERVYRKKRGTYPSNLLLPLSFG